LSYRSVPVPACESEIFGLRWKKVDLEARTIQVRGQYTHGEFVEFPKTDAGVRKVPIEAELARVLTEWKLAQKPERKQPDSLVVSTSTGGPICASNFLSREFYPALKAAKLPRVVFHSLRHAYKTILVSSDTPPAVVHTILGHANFATTLKLYGGVTSQALENAGGKIAEAFKTQLATGPDKTGQMVQRESRKRG
jgi:integrase